ncbi:MAG: MaoC family dehydratase N-terminal domain-containing protein [Halioglobus sp.]|nr:MaoC family dehydratase N-terminal domain-containing protein [Halioglobus sp.]
MSVTTEPKPFYYDDYVVGDEHPCATYAVERDEIIAFASKWDPQPWHIDESAARESYFGGLTACSAHIFSIFCITSQQWQSGVQQMAIAGLGFDNLRMHKPVYAGDTLRCVTLVEDKRESRSNPAGGICVCGVKLINQHDEVVFSVSASTMMMKDPARNSSV